MEKKVSEIHFVERKISEMNSCISEDIFWIRDHRGIFPYDSFSINKDVFQIRASYIKFFGNDSAVNCSEENDLDDLI